METNYSSQKLSVKIKEILIKYFSNSDNKMTFTSKEIGNYLNSLQQTLSEINIPIVYSKGKNKELRTSYKHKKSC